MQVSRIWKRLGISMAVLALSSALSALAQTGGLTGKATLPDGTPCVKCPVIIERQDVKGSYPTKTGKKGDYIYIGLPIGEYKVTLQDPSGKTLFYITHHVGMGDPTQVDFDLKKEMAAAQKEQAANPAVQKQMEEQAKEQKQMGSLKEYYTQGQQLMADKKYAEAAEVFEKGIPLAKDKNLVLMQNLTAQAYAGARQYDKAVDYYQKALAANPNDGGVHMNLGSLYAQMNKTAEARQEYTKAAEVDPANAAKAYYNLGAIMTNSGKVDEAAAAFKKATEIDPKYADAYYLEAQNLMGKATMSADGKVTPAPGTVEALQKYLELEPNGKYAASAQQMLQSIQGSVQTEFKKSKKK